MAKGTIVLIVLFSILTLFVANVFHLPNAENMIQTNRIRMISGTMKIIKWLGVVSNFLGYASEPVFQRQLGGFLHSFKPKTKRPANILVKETQIANIPVRFYYPFHDLSVLRPAVIYFHGGAYYLGSYDTHDELTTRLAQLTDSIIVSVNYRLAPEHPFPAGVDDCTTVTKYLLEKENANSFSIEHTRIAIGGDSAGGNFAAVVGRRLSSETTRVSFPRLMVLIYPNVQFFDFRMPSHVEPILQVFHLATVFDVLGYYFNHTITSTVVDNRHVTLEQKRQYRPYVDWSFIPDRYRKTYQTPTTDDLEGDPQLIAISSKVLHPDASPLLVSNEQLAKLPATYILTVEHDILRDEGFIYAARLKASGVSVVHHHFPKAFHGALTYLDEVSNLDIASEMLTDIVQYLRENL